MRNNIKLIMMLMVFNVVIFMGCSSGHTTLQYTVTFDGDGATVEASPPSMTVTTPATTLGMLPAPPTKDGFAFNGWYTEKNGGGTEFTTDTVVTANVTVFAKWIPCESENDKAFCQRLGKDCESVKDFDNCGNSRAVVTCGTCTDPKTCGGGGTANVCGYISSTVINIPPQVDILFVVDNSGSMAGKQKQLAESFNALSSKLNQKFGPDKYNIAVITTGMESQVCKLCAPYNCTSCDVQCTASTSCVNCNLYGSQCIPSGVISCINDTGENGRFQDYLGFVDASYNYIYKGEDSTCKIITSDNQDKCFYNSNKEGIVLVGDKGCGYERGLESMKTALSSDLLASDNSGFLRKEAILAIILVSDEEDCGKPGDVDESLPVVGGDICYYASGGKNPDGSDYTGSPLEPVDTYYNFLMGLKDNQEGMVKFAGIVGAHISSYDANNNPVVNANDPLNTITFTDGKLNKACDTVPLGCPYPNQVYCSAMPGTRYIALAKQFGSNGFIDTICQTNYSDTMSRIGTFIGCPKSWTLSQPILDPELVTILFNGVAVPRQSWTYNKDLNTISFAGDYYPCNSASTGEIRIVLIYTAE